MAAMTYDGLVAAKSVNTSLAFYVNYDLLPADDLITDALSFVNGLLRVREMRKLSLLQLATGTQFVALPADFLDPLVMLDDTGDEVQNSDTTSLLKQRIYNAGAMTQTGRPSMYALFDECFQFDVQPDADYVFNVAYYAEIPALSSQAPTNWLTVRYPKLFRAALLAEAFEFRQDDQAAMKWRNMATALIEAANQEADLALRGAHIWTERNDG